MAFRAVVLPALFAIGTVMSSPTAHAAGDVAKGKKAFGKCKACHAVQAGKNKIGPYLAGVMGRQAGTARGYKKYKGLKGADWAWDDASMDAYLTDPKKLTKEKTGKKSAMNLKTKNKKQRANLIAYLKTLK